MVAKEAKEAKEEKEEKEESLTQLSVLLNRDHPEQDYNFLSDVFTDF